MVYVVITHTKQLLCYWAASFSCLGQDISYDWHGEVWPQNYLQRSLECSAVNFWGFCSLILGVARIVRPHPNY